MNQEIKTYRDFAVSVLAKLESAGHEAYFAGGCVRDKVMGFDPDDYDVTTSAHPDMVMKLFPKTVPVGARFGVVLVMEGEHQVEVATFRLDGDYVDGRRPESVRYSEKKEDDVLRRDFTINGMLYNPLKDEVVDLVGGRDDISAKLIRAIGDPEQRFKEDKLRLMRAIRFAARFGYSIEEKTRAAIRKHAADISVVSPERIRDELCKMILHPSRSRAFMMLQDSGLLPVILPEISNMIGVEQPPEFHPEGDVFVHTMLLLDQLEEPGLELAWAGLLHDVGKPPTFERAADRVRFNGHCELGVSMTHDICRRLRFSNQQREKIAALVSQHMRFGDARKMKTSTLKKFMRQEYFEEHLKLHKADCLAALGDLSNFYFCTEAWDLYKKELEEEKNKPQALLAGADLIQLGYKPGPGFAKMLSAIEDARLDSVISTREEALLWLAKEFPLSR